MAKILFSSLLLFMLLAAIFSQETQRDDSTELVVSYRHADSLYKKAGAINLVRDLTPKLEQQQENWYRQALLLYTAAAPLLEKKQIDSLAFNAYRGAGLVNDIFDSTTIAKQKFLKAISLRNKLADVNDSGLFKPYVFAGRICYIENNIDSSLLLLKQAEEIQSHYSAALNESQRLYNLFGVIYYETGNYWQARNYFEKAISLLGPEDAINKDLLVNYKVNIASILVKLEEYKEANKIYQNILSYKIYNNEILHNIGIMQQKLGAPGKAINYFKQVKYEKNKRSIDLHYNFALAYADLHDSVQANAYIEKALEENAGWNGSAKNITLGLIYKFQGTELERSGAYEQAIGKYQLAIRQFDNNFNASSVTENPKVYSGAFSYINLFNTLVLKANAFEKLYQLNKDTVQLESSLHAYQAAFQLADYVEKTYDSDESRLFIGKIKHIAGDAPINICLQLFQRTQRRSYLERAYSFDQKNKASVLTLNIQDNKLRETAGENDSLFDQQSSIRQEITRFSLKAAQTNDSVLVNKINANIRDDEIRLGKLSGQINANPKYASKRSVENIPSIEELQEMLDKKTLLLSYHLSPYSIVITAVSNDSFSCLSVPIPKDFHSSLDSLREALSQQSSGSRYTATKFSNNLYHSLIKPIESRLTKKNRLVIIPEDELNYLPFEVLQDDANRYLVEKFAITYQYSTALIQRANVNNIPYSTLAFAPFANKGFTSASGEKFSALPASAYEVGDADGKILLGKEATKNYFLKNANHFGTVHLATHATINNSDSRKSYIAFYPGLDSNDNYQLTAPEIYNLKLDSINLIILSACETGSGNLVKGEGVMSLSRGFAYAGCPNVITSLWKAEDETTAFIITHLRQYLEEGNSKDIALQKSKIDLLKDEKVAPQFKAPNYWAHLILIGQFQGNENAKLSWQLILITFVIIVAILTLVLKRNKKTPA